MWSILLSYLNYALYLNMFRFLNYLHKLDLKIITWEIKNSFQAIPFNLYFRLEATFLEFRFTYWNDYSAHIILMWFILKRDVKRVEFYGVGLSKFSQTNQRWKTHFKGFFINKYIQWIHILHRFHSIFGSEEAWISALRSRHKINVVDKIIQHFCYFPWNIHHIIWTTK